MRRVGNAAASRDALVTMPAQEGDHVRVAECANIPLPAAEPRPSLATDLIRLRGTDGVGARDLVGRHDDSAQERIACVRVPASRLHVAVTSKHHMDAVDRSVTAALPEERAKSGRGRRQPGATSSCHRHGLREGCTGGLQGAGPRGT